MYLTRLRVSSHRFSVDSGRWTNVPINERLCTACNMLEDECHFVQECSLYTELWKRYISQYYWRRQNVFKFILLIKCDSNKEIKKISMFIEKAFAFRTNLCITGANYFQIVWMYIVLFIVYVTINPQFCFRMLKNYKCHIKIVMWYNVITTVMT